MKNGIITIVGLMVLIQLVFIQCRTSKSMLFSAEPTYYSEYNNNMGVHAFVITSDTLYGYSIDAASTGQLKSWYNQIAKCKITHQDGDFYEINSIDVAWINANRHVTVELDTAGSPQSDVLFVFRFPKYPNELKVLSDDYNQVKNGETEYFVKRSRLEYQTWYLIPEDINNDYDLFGQYFGIVHLFGSIDLHIPELKESYELSKRVNKITITYPTLSPETFSEYYLTGQYIKITPKSIFWNGEEYHAIDKKRLAGCKFISPNDTIQF